MATIWLQYPAAKPNILQSQFIIPNTDSIHGNWIRSASADPKLPTKSQPSLNQVSSVFSLFFHTTAHCSPPANQRGEEFSSQAEGDPLDGCLYQVQSTESGSSTSEDHQTAEPCMLHDELQTTLTFSKHIHQTTHEVRIRPRYVRKSADMYRDVTLFSGISLQVSMLTLIWTTLISNIALVRQRHKFTDDEAHSATSANLGRLP